MGIGREKIAFCRRNPGQSVPLEKKRTSSRNTTDPRRAKEVLKRAFIG
jgi:hypothetical protein